MKTQVEFRTSQFPPNEGEEEEINPGIWGRRLAEYLSEKLTSEGIEAGDIGNEDWGVLLDIKNEGYAVGVGCSHLTGGDDDEFLIQIFPDKPVVRRLFKKYDTTPTIGRLSGAIDKVLTADPQIRDLRWLDED